MNGKYFLLILSALILFGGGGVVVYNMTRGLRNNNPGNLENNGIDWDGLSRSQTDSRFYQFDDPVYGIRAMNKIIKTYKLKYGFTTIEQLINRWAPPFENDTKSYIQSVAKRIGVEPDEDIDYEQHAFKISQAIIKHENGLQPYDDETIKQGVSLAWA